MKKSSKSNSSSDSFKSARSHSSSLSSSKQQTNSKSSNDDDSDLKRLAFDYDDSRDPIAVSGFSLDPHKFMDSDDSFELESAKIPVDYPSRPG